MEPRPINRGRSGASADSLESTEWAFNALAQSESQYRTIFEDNLSPMLVCDTLTLRFVDVNRAACEFYGYPREKFLTMGPVDFYPRGVDAALPAPDPRALLATDTMDAKSHPG